MQSTGLNYFLFSRELAKELGIVDILPRSELFSPANIGRYLGIRWTDGKTVLVTWIGPDTKPLDETWIAAYRRAVEASQTVETCQPAPREQLARRQPIALRRYRHQSWPAAALGNDPLLFF